MNELRHEHARGPGPSWIASAMLLGALGTGCASPLRSNEMIPTEVPIHRRLDTSVSLEVPIDVKEETGNLPRVDASDFETALAASIEAFGPFAGIAPDSDLTLTVFLERVRQNPSSGMFGWCFGLESSWLLSRTPTGEVLLEFHLDGETPGQGVGSSNAALGSTRGRRVMRQAVQEAIRSGLLKLESELAARDLD